MDLNSLAAKDLKVIKSYKIEKPFNKWQVINLPIDIYNYSNKDLSNLRLLNIKGSDTNEVPFLINYTKIKSVSPKFEVINEVEKDGFSFFTFKLIDNSEINRINLDFGNQDYDLLVFLEGSNDNKEWFTILKNVRIFNITTLNNQKYSYNLLKFNNTKYKYYRVKTKSENKLSLNSVELQQNAVTIDSNSLFNSYTIDYKYDKKENTGNYNFNFNSKVKLSSIFLEQITNKDYVRDITIQTSLNKREGLQTIAYANYSSKDSNLINLDNPIVDNIVISINHNDNYPIEIPSFKLFIKRDYLIAKFDSYEGDFILTVCKDLENFGSYDINYFINTIPESVKELAIISNIENQTSEKIKTKWYESDYLLWLVVFLVSIILIYSSLKLMKSKEGDAE